MGPDDIWDVASGRTHEAATYCGGRKKLLSDTGTDPGSLVLQSGALPTGPIELFHVEKVPVLHFTSS